MYKFYAKENYDTPKANGDAQKYQFYILINNFQDSRHIQDQKSLFETIFRPKVLVHISTTMHLYLKFAQIMNAIKNRFMYKTNRNAYVFGLLRLFMLFLKNSNEKSVKLYFV